MCIAHRRPLLPGSPAQPCRISRISVRIRNTAPTHLVARASLASQVLALFRARKESATPPMEPDRPALLLAGLEEDDHRDRNAAKKLQNRNDKG